MTPFEKKLFETPWALERHLGMVDGEKMWIPFRWYTVLIACGLVFVLAGGIGWWLEYRDPCYPGHKFGETHWGGGAFHSGLGACAPKPWWRP